MTKFKPGDLITFNLHKEMDHYRFVIDVKLEGDKEYLSFIHLDNGSDKIDHNYGTHYTLVTDVFRAIYD
jgi:hypothetical protein